MTSSFDKNISRLKGTQELNLRQRRQNTKDRIDAIDEQVEEQVDNIGAFTDLLVGKKFGSPNIASGEGGIIPYRHVKYIQDQTGIAHDAEKEDRIARTELLKNHLETSENADTAAHIVKKHALLNGAFYHEASRFTELSPHAQAAYAQRKMAIYKNSEPDKLKFWQTKNAELFTIEGIEGKFNPSEVFGNPLYPPDLKEGLLQLGIKQIREQNGINGFSKEMLEIAGIDDYIGEDGNIVMGSSSKAIEDSMKVIRKNWNVESSNRDLEKYLSEFRDTLPSTLNPKGKASLNRIYHLITSLMDKDNKQMSGEQAWEHIRGLLSNELVNNPDFGDEELRILFEEIDPGSIGKKNPNGLPYYVTHRKDFDKIIDDSISQKDTDLDNIQLDMTNKGREYLLKIIKDINDPTTELGALIAAEGGLSDAMVMDIFRTYQAIAPINDGTMPELLSNLLTQQGKDQQEIKDKVRQALETRTYLTKYDIEGASAKTIKELKTLYGSEIFTNSALIANSTGHQFRNTTEDIINRGIQKYFNLEAEEKPWNYKEVYDKLDRQWVTLYQGFLADKFSPAAAADLANKQLQVMMGLRIPADKNLIPTQQEIDAFFVPSLFEIPEQSDTLRNKVIAAKDKFDRIIQEKTDGKRKDLFGEDTLLYKKDSKEVKNLIEYADSNGEKGSIDPLYIEVARLFPRLGTWEDLVNQQLIAAGHPGLQKYSKLRQAMTVDNLAEFHRLINFKGGPTSLVQAKIEAIDNSEVGIVEEVDEKEDEAYDWEAAAIKEAGPPPVKPKKEDFIIYKDEFSQERDLKGESIQFMAAMGEYNKAIKEYEAKVQSLIPAKLKQGEPLSRIKHTLGPNRVEVLLDGEWIEMSKKEHKLLLKTIKTFAPSGNFNYRDFKIIPDGEGGFTIEKKDSYLQSYWNMPDSPVLSPLIAEYASELYNANSISV